ncbi:MAG: lipopolysaccharide heptosyltransferase II [Cellvibrionaceae bacterium]|nr:lipopolysaccharide heptosyltransferase II [Cellvibrionaceae bacterium]
MRRFLIIGPSWVGDMVMAQSLFIALKQQHPETDIDVLAPAWCKAIVDRMPEVKHTIDMPVGHGKLGWEMRKRIGMTLRNRNYTQAWVLPNSWKSALIPCFAQIPLRTGWRGEMRYGLLNDIRKLDKKKLPLMVQRFVHLAHPKNTLRLDYPTPKLLIDDSAIPALLNKFSLTLDKPRLIFCPGAEFGSAKKWPPQYYSAVADKCTEQGWQIWIMGSTADKATGQAIIEQMQRPQKAVNLCGKTQLAEAVDLLSLADHVLSNDSGLMHIAAALEKPLTTIYGPTSPAFTPPLSTRAKLIQTDIACSPCFKRECPLEHHRCMTEITPEGVYLSMGLAL